MVISSAAQLEEPRLAIRGFLSARVSIAVAVLSATLIVGCARNQTNYPIGLLVPLTGGAASYGQNARRGANLAIQEFAKAHPSIHVELKVEDSRGESATGAKAAAKLVDLDKVVAIVGCVTSGVTLAAAPVI